MNDAAPALKRLMRTVWMSLPKSRLSYNLGKLITRTALRPEGKPCPVRVRFGGRIPMTLDLGSFVANDLYCMDGHFESVTLRLWRELACHAGVVLDIGSHIGPFALVAAEANPKARVIAVEADPRNFALLSEHSATYPNITPLHAAIADQPGEMWFQPGGANDGAGHLCIEKPSDPAAFAIQTRTLAEICESRNLPRVDLMKLDVEGMEHRLLAGESAFWRKFAPAHLIMELTASKRAPDNTAEILRAMENRGYRATRLQGLYAVPWGKPDDLANWHFTR
jgi:FkbM family methyltransferase